MKKRIFSVLLLTMMLIVLAACSSNDNDSTSENTDSTNNTEKPTTNTEPTTEATGGDLVIARLSDANSLDPHGSNDTLSSNVQKNIYETLVDRNENNEILPSLATSWERIDDVTWQFKLQQGVKFHDGSDFNAEVVKKNLDRVRDAKVASPRAFLFAMIEEVTVIDESTVQMITAYPFAPLLAHLSHSGGAMISGAAIDEDYKALETGEPVGAYINKNPLGTGFFKYVSWEPGNAIKLEKNTDYWGTPAKLDSVTFKVVPDSSVRVAELETGYAHITDPVQPIEVERINNSGNASVFQKPASSISYIGYNMQKAPFDNEKVRQALTLAIDRKAIINGIYEGFGIEAVGPLAPGVYGYTDDLTPKSYDLEKAKELLAEAGYADGFSTSIWTYDDPQRMDIAVIIQENLKQLNIDVKIEVLELGAFLDKTASGEQEMFILGWSNPTGDADYGMYALFHSSQFGTAGNRSFYKNETVDQLLDNGRKESDNTKRLAMYKEAQQLIIDDAPVSFVHHAEYLIGVSDKVKGFDMDNTNMYKLKDVTLD